MIHISLHNTKLNGTAIGIAPIPSVNLPPIITCRENAPCKDTCYACKGLFRMKNNQKLLWDNWEFYDNHWEEYFQKIAEACTTSKLFRWHSTGDIPSSFYFWNMVKLAKDIPDTKFLCFTKQYETVNSYIKVCGELPENLIVVFSAWGNFPVPNPYNLPVAYVRLKSGEGADKIPTNARKCTGYCAECILGSGNCWNMKHGDSVVFDEH